MPACAVVRMVGPFLAALAVAAGAHAHPMGTHTGLASRVSSIEPPLPGLLVDVLGGHERLSVRNWTQRTVIIDDGAGRPLARIAPGESRVWREPRIGWAGALPEREGLVRRWRIAGRAAGRRFEIVGFLGYRPPVSASDEDGAPTWAIVTAAAVALLLAAGLVLPLVRRENEAERRETARER